MSVSQYPDERRFLTTETLIIGGLFGFLLILWGFNLLTGHEEIFESPSREALGTAVVLLVAVAYAALILPIPFAQNHPRLAVFTIIVGIGHLSLFADSFALLLIFAMAKFLPMNGEAHFKFNVFVVKCLAALSALTVGSAFSIGELYALPHYLSSGFGDFAGLPMLIGLTPFSVILGLVGAIWFPVRFQPVKWDKSQTFATIKLVVVLVIVVATHNIILALGVILFASAITGRTTHVLSRILHEVEEGGATALALIAIVVLLEVVAPGVVEWLRANAHSEFVIILSAISSPFAGALLEPSRTIGEFYLNISYLMLGAPAFVSSSLVAIIIFRNTLTYADLPPLLQAIPGINHGTVVQEAIAYTVVLTPFMLLLAVILAIGNAGPFVSVYHLMFG